ncbi:MAG: PilZ domain-containing protein [Anaerolineae bacterium]|jgi:hypothetical protein|nr:PilZ domain-containing protein [Anaerolineae bacterium]
MEERRKLKRVYLMFYSRVFDLKSGEMLGYMADLNRLGMMVISEEVIPAEQVLKVRLDLPEFYLRPHLVIEARSVWCKTDVNPRFYNTGFEFSPSSEEDLLLIDRMIKDYGLQE